MYVHIFIALKPLLKLDSRSNAATSVTTVVCIFIELNIIAKYLYTYTATYVHNLIYTIVFKIGISSVRSCPYSFS